MPQDSDDNICSAPDTAWNADYASTAAFRTNIQQLQRKTQPGWQIRTGPAVNSCNIVLEIVDDQIQLVGFALN